MLNPTNSPPQLTRSAFRVVREDTDPYDASPEPPTVSRRRRVVIVDAEAGETVLATLGGSAFGVYWHLCKRAKDGQCWPSLDDIAEATKLTRKHVTRMLDALETGGWITRKKRSNAYHMATNTLYTIAVTSNETGCDMMGTSSGHDEVSNVTRTSNQQEFNYVTPSGVTKPPKSPTPKKSSMPADFDLSAERLAYAIEHGLSRHDAEELFEDMRLWEKQGGKYLDWHAAWQTWVRRLVQKRAEAKPVVPYRTGQNGRSPGDIMAEAHRIRDRRNGGSDSDPNMIDATFVERR